MAGRLRAEIQGMKGTEMVHAMLYRKRQDKGHKGLHLLCLPSDGRGGAGIPGPRQHASKQVVPHSTGLARFTLSCCTLISPQPLPPLTAHPHPASHTRLTKPSGITYASRQTEGHASLGTAFASPIPLKAMSCPLAHAAHSAASCADASSWSAAAQGMHCPVAARPPHSCRSWGWWCAAPANRLAGQPATKPGQGMEEQ